MNRPAFIAELLEATEKATKGLKNGWAWQSDLETVFISDYAYIEIATGLEECDASYIAIANPANILELARYIEELEAGRIAARNEALEEAAKEADRDIDENGSVMIRPYHEIADAIRALKFKENEHE